MFLRFFQNSPERNGTGEDEYRGGAPAGGLAEKGDETESLSAQARTRATGPADHNAVLPYDSFENIYHAAPANQPRMVYSILKVIEMLNSPHLAGMGPDAKRGSLLMALAAVGAEVTDILHDAMLRQRALNDYEDLQQTKLAEFEAAKLAENRAIQAELDRVKIGHLERIQTNMDEIARSQDTFRSWQKSKQKELNTIAEAATYCAPAESRTGAVPAVFEHAAGRM
jgi:hypothetical protein